MSEKTTCIKSIAMKKWIVGLYQLDNGKYFIKVETPEGSSMSETVIDYGNANYIFDMTVQDMEGH